MIGPDGKPAPSESTRHRRGAGGLLRVRAARVPGGAARRQTPRDHPQERHDAEPGLHARTEGRLHLRDLVPARHQARKGAARTRGNQSEPLLRRLQGADGRRDEGGARQPRHRARAGAPGGRGKRQGHAGLAEQLVRAQRRPGAGRQGHHQPAGELGKRIGRAGRDLRLRLARQERLPAGHQGNRRARPGSAAAGRQQGSGAAALRDRARRPGDHGAVDRLHEVPGRDRRLPGL